MRCRGLMRCGRERLCEVQMQVLGGASVGSGFRGSLDQMLLSRKMNDWLAFGGELNR